MATYIGQHERKLAVGVEATYGAIATMARYIPTEEATLDTIQDSIPKASLGVERAAQQHYKREISFAPSIKMPFEPDGVGELLYCFFGTVQNGTNLAHADGTQYSHIFTPISKIDDTHKSITIKDDRGQGTVVDCLGVRGNTLTLDFAPKEDIVLSFEGIGRKEQTGTASDNIVYGTWRPLVFSDVEVTLDGTAELGITTMSLELNNNLSEGYRLGTRRETTKPLPGMFEGHIKFSIEGKSADWERYIGANGSNVGMTIKAQGQALGGTGKQELFARMPKLQFMNVVREYNEGIMVHTIDAQMFEGGTSAAGTGKAITCTLYNNINAY